MANCFNISFVLNKFIPFRYGHWKFFEFIFKTKITFSFTTLQILTIFNAVKKDAIVNINKNVYKKIYLILKSSITMKTRKDNRKK